MKNFLSQQTITSLPVHDADLVSICIRTSVDGNANLTMTIEIDPEESLQPFVDIGIKTRIINLHFEKCWQIISNILHYQARREQIYDWKTSSESEKLTNLQERCVPFTVSLIHHKFEFSAGSTFEVISERVFVVDAT